MSAQAAADAQSAAPPPATAPKKKEKKICKEDPAVSGTRMAKRLCLTEEGWAQRSQGMTESARSGYSGKAEDH
ncbi:MAG TPA: hypothetical protein VF079_02795 [Sphingomicrobium sp.]